MTRPRTLLPSCKFSLATFVIIAFFTTPFAESAFAQQTSSIQFGVSTRASHATTSASHQIFQDTSSKRGRHTVRGALIGTGTGAAIGLFKAYRRTQGDYLDHSEDGLLYLYFPLSGAVIGLLLGGIVGYLWN